MKKIGSFLKGILVFIIVYAMEVVIVWAFGDYDSQVTNMIYGVAALIIMGIWYRLAFVRPFKNKKKKDYPTGFSFHTIIAVIFLGMGLQYVTYLICAVVSIFSPQALAEYSYLIENAGYTEPTAMIVVYSIILAPVTEELVFRGLIFRYTRLAVPFWVANIWQALLFALMHGNLMQGVYAFVMGLILGFICHRGRGIKYSIPVHMVFNIVGLFFSGFISLTLDLSYPIAMTAGVALTIFALWLFYTDFEKR